MKRNRRIPSLFLILSLCCLAWPGTGYFAAQSEKPVKGPVVQNVRTDGATITWATQRKAGELRKAPGGDVHSVGEPVFHRLELKGLSAGTAYKFNLSQEGIDAQVSFATPPRGPAPFSFIVLGDTRTRHEVHARAVAGVLKENPAFMLHAGDLVADGRNPDDWDKFFEIEKELLRSVPFYPVLGNHDRNAPEYFRYFAFPNDSGHFYSFDWGEVHIAALDTNEVGDTREDKEGFMNTQVEWLKQDLKHNKQPLTFVLFHHPLYTAVANRQVSAARLAAILESALLKGGVAAVFSGHDHNYQHHLKSGLHHIVTGGGGAPLYDVTPIPEITLKAEKTENFVKVRIEGRKAKIEAVDLGGRVIDSFEILPKSR